MVETKLRIKTNDIILEALGLYICNPNARVMDMFDENIQNKILNVISYTFREKFGNYIRVIVYKPIIIDISINVTEGNKTVKEKKFGFTSIVVSLQGQKFRDDIIFAANCPAGIVPLMRIETFNNLVCCFSERRIGMWVRHIINGRKEKILEEIHRTLNTVFYDNVINGNIYVVPLQLIDCYFCKKEKCTDTEESLLQKLAYGTAIVFVRNTPFCAATGPPIPLLACWILHNAINTKLEIITTKEFNIESDDDIKRLYNDCYLYLQNKFSKCASIHGFPLKKQPDYIG